VREEARYQDVAGEAAIDGTGSHELLEMCLINGVPAIQYDQQIIGANHKDSINGWLVAPDRIARVQMCLDYVTRRVAELKALFPRCEVTVEAECKSNPGEVFSRDDWWGTCDITITAFSRKTGFIYMLEVCDYKDGRGYVSEKNNTQLISYLFGKMPRSAVQPESDCHLTIVQSAPLPPGQVRMTIVQPKTNPVIRYQCTTRPEDGITVQKVIAHAQDMAVAAAATDDPNALCTPGWWCQWCKANPKRGGHCTADAEKSLRVVESMSDTNLIVAEGGNQHLFEYIGKVVADPKSLTVEQLGELADAEAGLMAAFGKVRTEIQERIEQGTSVPGYAMLPGNKTRLWSQDEAGIVKMLKARRVKKDEMYPAKLISPAAALKLASLTDEQKTKIERDYIAVKAGKSSLQKVSRDHQPVVEKDVAQSSTADMLFADVPKPDAAAAVSFL
jgi:hypothetical protein